MDIHVQRLLDGCESAVKGLRHDGHGSAAASLQLLVDQVKRADKIPQLVVTAGELQLGDVVRLDVEVNDSYPDMTVKQIAEGAVTFFRPYTHTGDFSCTAGVLCYVGISEFRVSVDDKHTKFIVVDRRKTPLR